MREVGEKVRKKKGGLKKYSKKEFEFEYFFRYKLSESK